jgi:penicillin-insensitive murein endopeptidase
MQLSCVRTLRAVAISLAALLTVAAGPPDTPAPGPVRIIGTEASGCIAGAAELPQQGPGFEQIRANRSSFWGAPSTIAGVETLAARARAAGLPDIYVGDISGPRGGPLRGGHASHQLGIDVDVWLDVDPKPVLTPEQRDAVEVASIVAPSGRSVDPARWSPALVTLMHLAATLPAVDRIFVHPAIKKQLCEQVTGDRSWLRLMRPWWGHASHMHIRFRCPPGQPDCHQGPPPPPGDGCDATLDWWFAELAKPSTPAKPSPPKPLPAACRAIMQSPAG